uniref:Uncharacterized protein n=1 Tax=Magallana gigas TaxID=29159 RepID=K1P3R0_MAGGI
MRMVVAGILLFYICGSVAMVTTPTGNRCFTCSFTVNKPWMKTECVNNTEQISIHDDSRPCKNYCYTEERFNIQTGKINSVLRGCEPPLVTGECIYSNPNNDCFKFCYSENCNNETNPWLHDNPNGCSYNVASGFLAVAVPLIIFFTP